MLWDALPALSLCEMTVTQEGLAYMKNGPGPDSLALVGLTAQIIALIFGRRSNSGLCLFGRAGDRARGKLRSERLLLHSRGLYCLLDINSKEGKIARGYPGNTRCVSDRFRLDFF